MLMGFAYNLNNGYSVFNVFYAHLKHFWDQSSKQNKSSA